MGTSTERLLYIIGALREHCAWTAALTHQDLLGYLVEECYELVEAVEEGHPETELRGELGDVLLQVLLHSAIAAERGDFTFDDVADALADKMIRRNTHVFAPDGTLRDSFPDSIPEIIASWDAAKAAEKAARAQDPVPQTAPGSGLPRGLPALLLAQKTLSRLERSGNAVPAELTPDAALRALGETGTAALGSTEALGGHLLLLAAAAQSAGLDAEAALRGAVARLPVAPAGGASS